MATFTVTEVLDDGATIKLVVTGEDDIFIQKASIDEISSTDTLVQIRLRGGRQYFFDEANVTDPAHADAEDLVDQIQDFLDTGGSLAAGASTEAKQDAILVEVTAIKLSNASIEGKVAEEVTQAANGVKLDNILTELVEINAVSTRPTGSGFLGDAGLQAGTTTATGNYSVTAKDFFYEIPTGKTFLLRTIVIYVEDGNNSFNSGDYGGLNALPVGIDVITEINAVERSLLNGELIKKNTDFGKHGAPLITITFGTGNESGTSIANLPVLIGSVIPLNGDNTSPDRIIVRCNDDFTNLEDHSFKIFGQLIDN